MNLPHRIDLGGVLIDGTEAVNGPTFSDITGWYGLPEARGSSDSIPNAHGSFARVAVWRESRVITITGTLHTDSRGVAEEVRDRLTAAWMQAKQIAVSDETGVWSAGVEVDRVEFHDYGAWSSRIPFTIDLVAPDPVRYRDPIVVGPVGLPVRDGGLLLPSAFPWNFGTSVRSVATVENSGSVPAYPTVRVTGSGSALSVQGGPRRVEFGAFSGEFVVDNLQRRAFLNGGDVTRQLLRRDWQSVPAGGVQDFSFDVSDASPDTVMTVEYRIGVW